MDDGGWFAEVDLDPDRTWLRMATRHLGDRPWLVFDDRRRDELALKAQLLAHRHTEVFAMEEPAGERVGQQASEEVLGLVNDELLAAGLADDRAPADVDPLPLHPLDRAGRLVQEDLCLLRPGRRGWVLAGASLCFPSRWRLADKIGRPLDAVHGPVDGYRESLARRVDTMLDRLGSTVVWRRNWFIHPDAALFQPDRPPGGDPVVPADHCPAGLYLRSERQTLRTLPESGWVLFTIRIQQAEIGRFVADPDRRHQLVRFLTAAPAATVNHRGISEQQRGELLLALGSAPKNLGSA